MAQLVQTQDDETPAEPATTEPARDEPKTWWSRHSGLAIAIIAIAGLVLLLALNMNCPGAQPG